MAKPDLKTKKEDDMVPLPPSSVGAMIDIYLAKKFRKNSFAKKHGYDVKEGIIKIPPLTVPKEEVVDGEKKPLPYSYFNRGNFAADLFYKGDDLEFVLADGESYIPKDFLEEFFVPTKFVIGKIYGVKELEEVGLKFTGQEKDHEGEHMRWFKRPTANRLYTEYYVVIDQDDGKVKIKSEGETINLYKMSPSLEKAMESKFPLIREGHNL